MKIRTLLQKISDRIDENVVGIGTICFLIIVIASCTSFKFKMGGGGYPEIDIQTENDPVLIQTDVEDLTHEVQE